MDISTKQLLESEQNLSQALFREIDALRDEVEVAKRANLNLRIALDAHHRHAFPNSDPDYTCRECGFDGTDVPTRQAYALAIENDCDADD